MLPVFAHLQAQAFIRNAEAEGSAIRKAHQLRNIFAHRYGDGIPLLNPRFIHGKGGVVNAFQLVGQPHFLQPPAAGKGIFIQIIDFIGFQQAQFGRVTQVGLGKTGRGFGQPICPGHGARHAEVIHLAGFVHSIHAQHGSKVVFRTQQLFFQLCIYRIEKLLIAKASPTQLAKPDPPPCIHIAAFVRRVNIAQHGIAPLGDIAFFAALRHRKAQLNFFVGIFRPFHIKAELHARRKER